LSKFSVSSLHSIDFAVTPTLNSPCTHWVHSPPQLLTIYIPCIYCAAFISLLCLLHFNCFPRLKMVSSSS